MSIRRLGWCSLVASGVFAACVGKETAPGASSADRHAQPASATASVAPSPATSSVPVAEVGPVENDPSQHGVLRAIAAGVGAFTRADGTWWSPLDCRAPPNDTARVSSAANGTAHGRKIYTLQIFDFETYTRETGGRAKADEASSRMKMGRPTLTGATQALVKVSYEPTEIADEKKRALFVSPVTHDGRTYYPGARKDLFVMYRPSDATIATDEGWLYGTVAPDGETVTSAGKVRSCMGCHAKAPHGRQFGVK